MNYVTTAEQYERQKAARIEAAHKAREVLFGLEYSPEDVLIVADWLLTGEATVALQIAEQTARNYGNRNARITDEVSPDAALWSPPGVDDGG